MNILSIIILLLVILLLIILLYFYKKKNIEFFKENKINKNKNNYKNKKNYKNIVNEDSIRKPIRKPIEEYNNNIKLKDKLFTKYLVGKKEKKEKFATLATLLNNNNYFI